MALITLDEAAVRIGTSRETIDQWVQSGFLNVHARPCSNHLSSADLGSSRTDRCVDEEELFEKADSMGWFMLSAENWDGPEEE